MKLLKDIAISETGFIFNPVTGESFSTNEIGMFILNELKNDKNQQEIIAEILNNYETTEPEAEKDYIDFINSLKFHNLLIN